MVGQTSSCGSKGGRVGGSRPERTKLSSNRAPIAQPVGLFTFCTLTAAERAPCPSACCSLSLSDITRPDGDSLSFSVAAAPPRARLPPIQPCCSCSCQSTCTHQCVCRNGGRKCVLYACRDRTGGAPTVLTGRIITPEAPAGHGPLRP